MQKQTWRWIGTCAIALSLPLAAAAQQAFTRGSVNLRAGPSSSYPLVAVLAPGQPLQVMGCTAGYGWCDIVLSDGLRGWAYAGSLDYAYEEQHLPLATYGAVIGVPIVTFAIGSYWGDYYRDRPWYGQPRWWGGRPPPPPVTGWRPLPAPVPAWRPNPWPGPGYHPPAGARPPAAAFRPPQPVGIRPPVDPGHRPPSPPAGIRPPAPDHGFRPGGPGRPDWNAGRPRGEQGGGYGRSGGDQGNHRGHGEGGGGGRGDHGGGNDRGQGRGHGDR
ncbi:SH3 domain-containing protein [Variovorax ureilyticus]|uniref:SH3 domain-containing protein n=1 Tax=Variovorax ureilyticus TaxID=1836198 RepID=A0ABU8VF81_9BURK